jgi:hypothetical protein
MVGKFTIKVVLIASAAFGFYRATVSLTEACVDFAGYHALTSRIG